MAAAGTGPTSTPRPPSTTRPKAGAVSPVKRAAVDGQKATKPRTGTPQNNISGDDSKSALVCKVVGDSDCSFIVRTNKAPREIAAAVERSLKGVQQGSMNHLLFGPPRATMWAYILESKGASNILAISLVTKENQDREYVEQSVRAPLTDSVLKDIDGKLEIRSAESPLGRLRDEILHARLVPVSEYSS
jgi:hypothetical protein